MNKTAAFALAAVLVGLAAAATAFFLRPGLFRTGAAPPQIVVLSPAQVEKVLLYATLKDGQLSGKFFNQNPDVTVTQITVEAAPKDEGNPFNKFSPRFFNVSAIGRPNSMSSEFRVETGALNPDFHVLRVTEGQASRIP